MANRKTNLESITIDEELNIKIDKMNLTQLESKLPPIVVSNVKKNNKANWKNIGLSHHIVFNNFMDNENMCHALFKIILQNFNLKLNKLTIETEKTIEGKGKGVRLDVCAQDDKTIVNVEMQGKIKYLPPKRLRNYLVALDKDQLEKGQDHTELKNTFIIIVTPEDPFGLNEPVYIVSKEAKPLSVKKFKKGEFIIDDYTDSDFELKQAKRIYNKNDKLDKPIFTSSLPEDEKTTEYDDGTYIIYLNASSYDKVENIQLKTFLAYIMGEHIITDDFFYVIHERFKKVKCNEKMESDFMIAALKQYYYNQELKDMAFDEFRQEITKEIRENLIQEVSNEIRENVIQEVSNEIRENVIQEVSNEIRENVIQEFQKEVSQKEVNRVIKMINKNFDDELIQEVTDFTLEEISKIRESNK